MELKYGRCLLQNVSELRASLMIPIATYAEIYVFDFKIPELFKCFVVKQSTIAILFSQFSFRARVHWFPNHLPLIDLMLPEVQ